MEAAVASLLFFTLVLGIFEGATFVETQLAISSVTTTAVRTAAVGGSDALADHAVLAGVRKEARALRTAAIERIVVYRPSAPGEPPSDSCRAGVPGPTCNVYAAADLTRPASDFGCRRAGELDASWCPTTRRTKVSDPPDFVGVWIRYRHDMTTMLFGATRTVTQHQVLRLEPRTP